MLFYLYYASKIIPKLNRKWCYFLVGLWCYHKLICNSNCQFACFKNHICIFFLIISIFKCPNYDFLLVIWVINLDLLDSDHPKLVFRFFLYCVFSNLYSRLGIFKINNGFSAFIICGLPKPILILIYNLFDSFKNYGSS